jgi:hypothetical protein
VYSTISSRDSRIVLPVSRVISTAISSARSMQSSNARLQISTLSSTVVRRHVSKADRAAATAWSTCSSVAPDTVPTASPVSGFVTVISSPPPAIHSPSMNAPRYVVT